MAEGTTFLLDLGILLAFALILGVLFVRLKLPVVAAEILAGMIAGPYVLGWVTDTTTINDLSTIGIVLLLFVIGLELDPIQLGRMAGRVLAITAVEVVVSFVLGFVACSIIGATFLQSIIFASVASFTSTAIVGRVFLSRHALDRPEAGVLMGMMVAEDMIAVVSLVVISSFASNGGIAASRSVLEILLTIFGGLILILAGYFVATYIAPRIIDSLSHYEEEYEEIPFLFALGLGFSFAVLAAAFGYSPGTGAFVIGLSIRGKRSRFLETRIATIKDLFILIFFISMGTLINPVPALSLGLALVLVMVIVVLGKFLSGFATSRIILGTGLKESYLFGTWLIPRGEFSFVIGQLALTLGIINGNFFSLIGLVVLVTAIVGPILQKAGEPRIATALHPMKPRIDP